MHVRGVEKKKLSVRDIEKIKLCANYLNGCAVAFFSVGCLGVLLTLMLGQEAMTFEKYIAYIVFFLGSIVWHLGARRALNGLSD